MTAHIQPPLAVYDVSDLVGLHIVVMNAAHEITESDGEVSIEIPDLEKLSAAAAVARCLMPIRLQPREMRAMRRIAGLTAVELANRLGDKTSAETISRWENGKLAIGGYAEKIFRLVICAALHEQAPGVGYHDGAIAKLVVYDPFATHPDFEVPPVTLLRVKVRSENSNLIDAWGAEFKEAA